MSSRTIGPNHRNQPQEGATLSQHVANSMADYFHALNGNRPSDLYRLFLEQVEAPLFRAVLDYSDGNQTHAADILGLNRATLRKKLRQYDITP